MSVSMMTQPIDTIIKSVRLFEKDGKIHLDYRVYPEYKIDGKERSRFSTGEANTKRAIQRTERNKFALSLAHFLENNRIATSNDVLTLGDIAMDALQEDRYNRQEDTQKEYERMYEIAIKHVFEKTRLSDIKVSDVKKWKNDLLKSRPLSKARYTKYHRVFSSIFNYAIENELSDKNPVKLMGNKDSKLFTINNKSLDRKYYTRTEVDAMLAHTTGWFKVMLTTLISTGCRTGEIIALHWSDLDFEKKTISIQRSIRKGKLKQGTKTNSGRIILMSKPLKEALQDYMKERISDEWIFPNPKTLRPYYDAKSIIRWKLKPLLKELNIEYITLYACRHSFASLATEQNIPMVVIQKQLGHLRLSTTTDHYIKHDLLNDSSNSTTFDNLYS